MPTQTAPAPPAAPDTTDPAAASDNAVDAGVQAPPDDYHDGSMIALYPPTDIAAELAVPGGLDPADMHVTIAYIGETNAVESDALHGAAAAAAATVGPFVGQVGGHGRFTGADGGDVLVALIDSPGVEQLRRAVVDALTEREIELPGPHGFSPHMTLAYLDPAADTPVTRIPVVEVPFRALSVVYGDKRTDIALTGDPTPGAAEVDGTGDQAPDSADQAPEGKAASGGPPIGTGAFVQLGDDLTGRVDMVVTSGTVPAANAPNGDIVDGTTSAPAARVVVYEQAGAGLWKATGKKVAAKVASLRRCPPLRTRQAKSLQEALADLVAVHADAGGPPVDGYTALQVYDRGVAAWPGEEVTALDQKSWGLGRVSAYLATVAGYRPAMYVGDDDLLPDEAKAAGGRWSEGQHPRDANGKFIEVGGRVKIFGGGMGTVVGNAGGGRIVVRRDDGTDVKVHRGYLVVQKRPDGSAPTDKREDNPAAVGVGPAGNARRYADTPEARALANRVDQINTRLKDPHVSPADKERLKGEKAAIGRDLEKQLAHTEAQLKNKKMTPQQRSQLAGQRTTLLGLIAALATAGVSEVARAIVGPRQS